MKKGLLKKSAMFGAAVVFAFSLCAAPVAADEAAETDAAAGNAQIFEAEYAEIDGQPRGMVTQFFALSEKCFLTAADNASNGYLLSNAYEEGGNKQTVTFTITSDTATTAKMILRASCGAKSVDFNDQYIDTTQPDVYPITLNGEELTSDTTVSADDALDEDGVLVLYDFDFGEVELQEGENVFEIKTNANTRSIDYLSLETDAELTWTETEGWTVLESDGSTVSESDMQ